MISQGTECYNVESTPCTGVGYTWSDDDLTQAINESVASVVFDDEGKADISALLHSVADTEFAVNETLSNLLADPDEIENWRVGEAIAETYLTDHRSCYFPWPDGRDERKSGSSLPGADLVGLHQDDDGDCFAFGEVKTSEQKEYPPQAMYGRTGMKKQLEDLRDQESIRSDLVKYLAFRALSATWKDRFQEASKRYLVNSEDVYIYGFMVRDVDPHEDDIRVRVDRLSNDCSETMVIELIVLYLPQDSIQYLSEKVFATRTGGES